ncbi:NusA-like transcription termination signal-binding factor [Haloarchaeobius sp. DFWS5]|uniref:NusA-like transcription termination signal-binding factor n=1 Tax=Haloarchaeobius sp. DFWS5 TaxID=3446114 RepID=UPI003EB8236E
MGITLDGDALQFIATFEAVTGADASDCVVEDDRLLLVVAPGDMPDAIGPGGAHVREFEEQVGREVKLVEDSDDPADFVANALAPAAVYNVTISEGDETVAYVEVAQEDHGVAIGRGGRTIEAARTLAGRHFDIDDIQLT